MATPLNMDRVTKLIVLLSSDKDGEVLAAVRALDKMLKGADQTWHDLAARVSGGNVAKAKVNGHEKKNDAGYHNQSSHKSQGRRYTSSADKFTTLLKASLTPWEREFVTSVYDQWRRRGTFSERQSEVLNDILNRAKNR